MKFTKAATSALLLAPSLSFASVEIDIPRGVQLLTVNGEDAGYSSLGFDYKDNLTLDNGLNQIVFRVAKIVRESGQDKTKFKSTPLVATFNESDLSLRLTLPNIETLDQGMAFDTNPTFTLASDNGEPKSLVKDNLVIGFKLMPDMVHEVNKYNQSTEIASLRNFQSSPSPASTTTPTASIDNDSDTYQVLKNAYNNATSEEKKKFLTWAISNFE
ncbi:DUF2057 domain-containing protein [Vibrio mexicanus]|uniref:YccT family protein n=1 Tax=Vibrio mexicanus TaxID=1004326 RepID=UPI00063C1F71|nr:DUF2057 domain-containing protein [Vibrio mexicanus]